jgi:hypothetical protein
LDGQADTLADEIAMTAAFPDQSRDIELAGHGDAYTNIHEQVLKLVRSVANVKNWKRLSAYTVQSMA